MKNTCVSERASREAGFTILEVLISMAILVFISFGIYQATLETYRLRDILLNEGDFYNGIRMAMDIVQRDVAQIYNPVLLLPPKPKPSAISGAPGLPVPTPAATAPTDPRDTQLLLSTDLGQTTNFWHPAVDKTGLRPSRFVGKEKEMTFVSVSHVRIYKDAPESDFIKIKYELKRDEDRFAQPETSVLMRSENTNAFNDDDSHDKDFARYYPLLRGIKELRFEYYWKEKDRPEKTWDTDKEDFRNIYPDEVRVFLSVTGGKQLNFDGVYVLRPEVPLRELEPTI